MIYKDANDNYGLPLIVIGNSKNHRSFKNINMDVSPVNYFTQKNTRMNHTIFVDWSNKIFASAVKKHFTKEGLQPNAMLIMNDSPTQLSSRLKSEDGNLTCHF